jgi:hypothetical protein
MRPVINLKRLNTFVAYLHFKMENISSLIDLLRPNDFIARIDLKDAFRKVRSRKTGARRQLGRLSNYDELA